MSDLSLLTTASPSAALEPAMTTSVGFKDWALICAALGMGRQSLILRKGGIAEGRAGFRFKHEAFFLFPTQYHQQAERVRPEALAALGAVTVPPPDTVEIRYFFALEGAIWLDGWETVAGLEEFHVWREEVVRERFEYGEQRGLQCAFGRVYVLEQPWSFPDRPSYGGCRSWVTLPESPVPDQMRPVLDDERHEVIMGKLRGVLPPA